MKRQNISRSVQRHIRARRIRNKVRNEQQVISHEIIVNKTDRHIYAQLVDLSSGKTLFTVSTLSLKLPKKNKESASKIGAEVAKKALEKNVVSCRFNRNGYPYHGIVQVLADSARENGLKF